MKRGQKDRKQRATDKSRSQLGRDGAGIGSTGTHRGEQRNGLQNLRPDTVAYCACDDMVELLSNAISALAPAAQVIAPSVPEGSEGRRWFTSLRITRFMTIPVCGAL